MPTPLLFPLRSTALVQPVLGPRVAGAASVPVGLPWRSVGQSGIPSVVHRLLPYPPKFYVVSGTTRDSTGAALGSCVVKWYRTADDALLDQVTSDASGAFAFRTAGQPPTGYYLVAYKAGSPDVAGTSVNTLAGA